jgi:hypothetical protein
VNAARLDYEERNVYQAAPTSPTRRQIDLEREEQKQLKEQD